MPGSSFSKRYDIFIDVVVRTHPWGGIDLRCEGRCSARHIQVPQVEGGDHNEGMYWISNC